MPITADAATTLLEDAGYIATSEAVDALILACHDRHHTRASAIVNQLSEQPDAGTILRLGEAVDRNVLRGALRLGLQRRQQLRTP